MTSRSGWFAPRIEREHLKTLFGGWKLRAWIELNADADYKTGVVRMTENEMVLAWDASKGSVGRWLADLAAAGYVYTERAGQNTRAGRLIRIASAEEWGRKWGRDGVENGAEFGAIISSNGAGNHGGAGVENGAEFGAEMGQRLGHVKKKEEVKETSSPSEKRDKNAGTRTRKGTRRCPADWQPQPAELALAAQLGVDCEWQAGKMRDHTFSTPRTDWDATFRNWLREAAERGQARSNGNGGGSADTGAAAVPEGERLPAVDLLTRWLERQPAKPSNRERERQASIAVRICSEQPRAAIAAAWWGLTHRFPWARPPDGRSEPWDLGTLEAQFAKSVQYAMENHPVQKAKRQESEFQAALRKRRGTG